MALDVAILAMVTAPVLYGTYFVPVKKYDVADGFVYQWYQCCGIILSGIVFASANNDWTDAYHSSGFYVAPEGLLSGLVFQLANVTATHAVKIFGLGNYYTVHQVSNLGLTFVVGVFGSRFGLPATPPRNLVLASLGFLLVLLGMLPVMFMEKEKKAALHASRALAEQPAAAPPAREAAAAAPANCETPPRTNLTQLFQQHADDAAVRREDLTQLFQQSVGGAATRREGPLRPVPELQPASISPSATGSRRPSFSSVPPIVTVRDFRMFNARSWDGTVNRASLLEMMDEPTSPVHAMGSMGLVTHSVRKDTEEEFLEAAASDATTAEDWQQLQQRMVAEESQVSSLSMWLLGFMLSLLAGALYSAMYMPLLCFKERMRRAGRIVDETDSFFSMCLGLFLASSAWLLCGGVWQKYRGRSLAKSVLRPALLSGILYACACLSFLYTMQFVPYAVGYAVGLGGGLMVSMLWATLVFGEASTPFNRRCIKVSFAGITMGIILLGLSA